MTSRRLRVESILRWLGWPAGRRAGGGCHLRPMDRETHTPIAILSQPPTSSPSAPPELLAPASPRRWAPRVKDKRGYDIDRALGCAELWLSLTRCSSDCRWNAIRTSSRATSPVGLRTQRASVTSDGMRMMMRDRRVTPFEACPELDWVRMCRGSSALDDLAQGAVPWASRSSANRNLLEIGRSGFGFGPHFIPGCGRSS